VDWVGDWGGDLVLFTSVSSMTSGGLESKTSVVGGVLTVGGVLSDSVVDSVGGVASDSSDSVGVAVASSVVVLAALVSFMPRICV
jgi:hypothetical protein